MRHATALLAIAAMIAAGSPAAIAADSVMLAPELDAPVSASSIDWDGFYAGVYGVGQLSPAAGGELGLGVNLGINARVEFVLVGAEVAVHGLNGAGGTGAYVQTLGRAGVAATDDVVVYGAGGLGFDVGPLAGGVDALVGGGVELALTESVSLRGQYLHGFDLAGANPKEQVAIGANFHF